MPHTRFEERLVAQVNRLENPLNWVILFMAHIYHRFNMETLDWIAHHSNLKYTQDIDYPALIKNLPGLSFVRQSGSGRDFVLHDEMRRLVTLHCWDVQDANQHIRRELSRCIVKYCEQQMGQRLGEQEQQLYSIMKLYHLLFLNLEDGLNYFEAESRRAVNAWRSAFARSLLQEVRLFSSELSQEQQYMLIFAGARLLRGEEDTPSALQEHERLQREASAEWYSRHAVEILIEKGRCYLLVSQLREAGDCFSQALALGRARGDVARSAYLLNMLGFIHRRRGELDKALEFYEECVLVQKATGQEVAYADTLNNISNVYRLKGRIEEALRICKISLSQRRRLVQEGKTGERSIALSLNTLGLIYLDSGNYTLAEQSLFEAFDIYSRYNDKRSIAMFYSRLGRVQMARGDLARAGELFEKAREASEDINPEALVASLNRQGRVYLLQNQWETAVPLFQRAIAVADQIHDSYQRTENLIYYAVALERLGKSEETQELWQQVYDLSSQENYLLLRARAE
ncbi:MAG TPA: tetratricopeptide repeat protein, partial [Ktedonobacteraceae bacterium]|nr:tetratricopeptide repeat protein [Ktedonobacteraceae bacterium]